MKRVLSAVLAISVLMTAVSITMGVFAAYGEANVDKQIYIDAGTGTGSGGVGATVGNATYTCQNLALELVGKGLGTNPTTPGFERLSPFENDNREGYINSDREKEYGGGAVIRVDNRSINYRITIAGNPIMKKVAENGQAKMRFKGKAGGDNGSGWKAYGHIYVYKNGTQILHASEDGWGEPDYFDSKWFDVSVSDVFDIKITGGENKDDKVVQGVEDFLILFKDDVRPILNDYTFETNGIEHTNSVNGRRELLIPQYRVNDNDTLSNEKGYMDVKFNFSEAVQTEYSNNDWYPKMSDEGTMLYNLANHVLFTNPSNTGYSRMGEQAKMKLIGIENADNSWTTSGEPDVLIRNLGKTFNFRYTAERGDFSSNKAIPNQGDWKGTSCANNVQSLATKLDYAHFHDPAGNAVSLSGTETADSYGNVSLNGKSANPFGYYDVIVDAEPPTYSKTMNGIYPDILTKLVLNKNDVVDFQVNFSESVVPKRYYQDRSATGWQPSNTYLHLNNGQKAYYVKGDGTKTWLFNTEIGGEKSMETPMLKVLALANDAHKTTANWSFSNDVAPNLGDTFVLTDYVGNPLTERANVAEGSIQSSIEWAQLSVDNTAPVIGFDFPSTGASNARWGMMGSASFNAIDDAVPVPSLDPQYSTLKERPSFGIFRPSNTTSEDGNVQTGLVYYIWSKNPDEPEILTKDEFAAVKRYSLTGTQPDEYKGTDGKAESLLVANNYSDSVIPPPEAYTSENSGVWYLHAFTSDMTWDSARQRIQYNKMLDLKNTEEGKELYQAWLDEYEENNSHDHSADRELSPEAVAYADGLLSTYINYSTWIDDYESSESHSCPKPENQPCDAALEWALSQARKTEEYKQAAKNYENENPQYKLAVPNCADAENYATYEGMKYAGNYDLWSDADYKSVDSNWTYAKTEIWLDNTIPEISIGSASGNNMSKVDVNVEATDIHSGLRDFKYQFVPVDGNVSEAAWTDFEFTPSVPDKQSATATTFAHVTTDGSYNIYVKATDSVGNTDTVMGSEVITVNSESTVVREFGIPSNADGKAVKSVETTFSIGGLDYDISSIKYAVTDSVVSPTEGYANLENPTLGTPIGDKPTQKYTVPAIEGKDGLVYLHIEVVENAPSPRTYHFYNSYKTDNTAPEVIFNPSGIGYPKQLIDVGITASDANNGIAEKYILIKADAAKPTLETADGWTAIDGTVTLDGNELLAEGEEADYLLFVYAADEAGNAAVIESPIFMLYREAEDPGVPDSATSELLEISGDAQNGFYGIVKVDLGVAMKEGYSYSVSSVRNADGVITVEEPWSRWQSYTNFVKAKLPISNINDRNNLEIWVKFKSPGGTVSEPDKYNKIIASGEISTGNLYATAEKDILKKLPIGKEVTLEITVPAGIKVTPSSVNPDGLSGSGKTYRATGNACYSFDITDMSNTVRKDVLYVVVDNFDEIVPKGNISYNIVTPTNTSVTATLDTSEPVRITNNGGKASYIFKESGSFTFEFEDEAGNKGMAEASVDWIDKTAPEGKISKSYLYESNGKTKEYGTLKDGTGNVVLAQGVILTPEKATSAAKDFTVISNDKTIAMRENGKAEFTVADAMGNKTVLRENVDFIVSEIAQPEISYDFVDDDGNTVTPIDADGMKIASANVRVTMTGVISGYSKGNRLYDGTSPVSGTKKVPVIAADGSISYINKAVSNEISSDANGSYSFVKVYKDNGDVEIAISDKLGNKTIVPLEIRGIDRNAPEIKLNNEYAAVTQNENNFDWKTSLGGYTVTDDFSAELVTVALESPIDLSKVGKQTATYVATDAVGNTSSVTQNVYVMPESGLLVLGNKSLVSAVSSDKALFKTNVVTFDITRYDLMKIGGEEMVNELATYDVYYVRGLFREGQLKYIAEKLTYDELIGQSYTVRFDKAGWYTVIVRNAEREREFTTFFISAMDED